MNDIARRHILARGKNVEGKDNEAFGKRLGKLNHNRNDIKIISEKVKSEHTIIFLSESKRFKSKAGLSLAKATITADYNRAEFWREWGT